MNAIRHALRSLLRSPSYTLTAGFALAIGIGANTAVFSVVDGILLRSLPYPDEGRVVRIYNRWEGTPRAAISPAEYFDYVDGLNDVFTDFGVWAGGSTNLTGGDQPERLPSAYATAGALRALGAEALRGRIYGEIEDSPGGPPVVLLSHELWLRRFGGRPDLVGTDIMVDAVSTTVVGILPAGFGLPSDFTGTRAQLIAPLGLDRAAVSARGSHFLNGIARLAPGVTAQQAGSRLDAATGRMVAAYPDDYPSDMQFGAQTIGIREDVVGNVRPVLLVLFAAVGLVLLVACANVAGLTLARTDSRQREFAVRTALGAARRHIAFQLLGESLILSIAGAAVGVLVAVWSVGSLLALQPASLPRVDAMNLDVRVLAFAALVTIVTAVLFTISPLLRASRDPSAILRGTGRGSTASASSQRMRQLLVTAELALTVVLLLGAGLLIRSMILLLSVRPGYTTENVLTSLVSLPAATYGTDEQRRNFFGALVDRAAALPGVEAAGAVTNLPLTRSLGDLNIRIEGRPIGKGEVSPRLDWQVVTPGYFDAIGMKLVRGRAIEARDDERVPGVVVINEAAAKLQFPGEDAIGKRFVLGGNAGPGMVTVVGIVGDVRQSGLNATPQPEMYLAHRQFTFWNGGSAVTSLSLVLRTSANPAGAAPAIRRLIGELDPNLPSGPYRTMEEIRSTSVAQPRFVTTLLALFAAMALLLASVGVYGMISLHVGLRRKEIGVRLALGAQNAEVLRLVLRQGLGAVLIGIAIGTLAALALARSLSSLLYGVAPTDPVSLAAVITVLFGAASAAFIGPVRRAIRTDPISTLRND